METLTFNVIEQNLNIRIDAFLSSKCEELSRTRIQKLIDEKKVFVNNLPINKNYKTKLNDCITVFVDPPKPFHILPENIPINIVFEDKDIIIVNKPQNMVVHPGAGNFSHTLVNALMYHCGENLSSINGVLRPGIVHRIDKNTSGILVVAKNDIAHQKLSQQLADHSMQRVYYAIVKGVLEKDFGTIDAPIGRHRIDRKKMTVTNLNSKQAITHYEVLQRFSKFTFIKLKLETGRTHQIRVHMAHIGHPLLGDTTYGQAKQPYNLLGQVLHAKYLGFIHPTLEKYVSFDSELPEYFQHLLKILT